MWKCEFLHQTDSNITHFKRHRTRIRTRVSGTLPARHGNFYLSCGDSGVERVEFPYRCHHLDSRLPTSIRRETRSDHSQQARDRSKSIVFLFFFFFFLCVFFFLFFFFLSASGAQSVGGGRDRKKHRERREKENNRGREREWKLWGRFKVHSSFMRSRCAPCVRPALRRRRRAQPTGGTGNNTALSPSLPPPSPLHRVCVHARVCHVTKSIYAAIPLIEWLTLDKCIVNVI